MDGAKAGGPADSATLPSLGEPHLDLPPAREWEYKAEGKHNVVMTYAGTAVRWVGLAVRLRKAHTGDATECVPEEHLLFPTHMDEFAKSVMIPLLGKEYVDQCVTLSVAPRVLWDFQARLEACAMSRPIARRHVGLDTTACRVMLMTDSTTVGAPDAELLAAVGGGGTGRVVRLGAPLAVEIKPKAGMAVSTADASVVLPLAPGCCPCQERPESPARGVGPARGDTDAALAVPCGALADSPADSAAAVGSATAPFAAATAATAGSALAAASKFRMQQVWKVTKGKALRASAYCPLDLFSSSRGRRLAALRSLVQTPHNNFRLFARGAAPFPPADHHDRRTHEQRELLKAGVEPEEDAPAAMAPAEYEECLDTSLARTSVGQLCASTASAASPATRTDDLRVEERACCPSAAREAAVGGESEPGRKEDLCTATWHGLDRSLAAACADDGARGPRSVLLAALVEALEREPLLARLRGTQCLSKGVRSGALWRAFQEPLEAASGQSFKSPKAAYKWAHAESTIAAQAAAVKAFAKDCVGEGAAVAARRTVSPAAAATQRFLVAQAACDCSVLISLQLAWVPAAADCDSTRALSRMGASQAKPGEAVSDRGEGAEFLASLELQRAGRAAGAATAPVPAAGAGEELGVARRPIGAFRLRDCLRGHASLEDAGVAGSALAAQLRGNGVSWGGEEPSVDDVWVFYRFSVVDLEPKMVSRIPKYAAKDAEITAAFAKYLRDPGAAEMPGRSQEPPQRPGSGGP